MVTQLRTRSIVSIIIVILTISSCYLFYYINKQRENVRILIESHKDQVRTVLPFYAHQIDKQYSARILSFVEQRENIISLFTHRDREGLEKAVFPIFTALRRENSFFDHIDFILPDTTVFLRVNDSGADNSQEVATCFDAIDFELSMEIPVSGFIHGRCGLSYAIMIPVVIEKKKVGTVLFGIRIGAFVEDIQNSLGIRTALALTGNKQTAGNLDSRKILSDNYVLYPYGDQFFTSKAGEIDLSLPEQRIVYESSVMVVFPSYIIRDRKGNEIGRMLQALNLTDITLSYRNDLIRLALVTLMVIVIASVILYWNFNKVLSELLRLNESLRERYNDLRNSEKQLETLVADRTEELEKANRQLQNEIKRRQEANVSLSRSIEEWQSTFDAITDPVTILDKDLEVVIANKAAHELLAKSKSEIIGNKCHELFIGSSRACKSCLAQEVMQIGEQREFEIDSSYLGKTLIVTCAPIYDGKDFLGYVHTARDVTEEKKLKKQLAQAQKMEAIATLAGGIAHDFNNILGAILGNADLLLYRLSPQPQREHLKNGDDVSREDIESHLEAIKKAGNRAKELVSQILAFSRQGKSQRQNADITPVIKEGVKLLRSSLPANIQIKSDIQAEVCQVYADLSQMHQVLMNLCTNAAQAMAQKGGILEINLRQINPAEIDRQRYPNLKANTPYVSLTVKDTGHGMSPEVMERIFDPFFTTKDVSEGTGMGLAVIHGIISSHDGELDVQSGEGVGSEFTVFFPCVDSKQEATEDVILGLPRGSEKILFVDDEEDILKMSTRMLEYLGYTVYGATSGEQAYDLLTREPVAIDMIITDYSMPGMSGVQLARDLIDAGINVPVVLCSGFSDSVILEQEARRGIKKFMSKPLDMKKLAVTIREVLQPSKGRANADSDNR